jgi:hypothetical protein
MNIIVLANKSNKFGLYKDVAGIRKALGGYTVKHCDPLEAPTPADVLIHLEVPIYGWAPWAKTNILMVNPEHWQTAWDAYLPKFDIVVVRDEVTAKHFLKKTSDVVCIPWGLSPLEIKSLVKPVNNSFVWVLAGSANKRAYVSTILQAWRPTYPMLTISTTASFDISGVVPPNVTIMNGDLTSEDREIFKSFRGHICCSRAEGFGYTAAEAEQNGSFTILNSLPCYLNDYSKSTGVVFLPSNLENTYYDTGASFEKIQMGLDAAMVQFNLFGDAEIRARQAESFQRWLRFSGAFAKLISERVVRGALVSFPPRLDVYPQISIVTLIYNRKKFFDLACHSLMISDYPKDKIEWILVDDSDDPMEQNSDTIMGVANSTSAFKIVYVPLIGKRPISDKRNIGVDKATSDIILFMDDDDHYPETSIRRRVGWLTKHPWNPKAVACTTIACYDLVKGISAVNVPPMDLPLEQRVSEATLTFYKSWWAVKPFPRGVHIGEGEGFLTGRTHEVLEMPPQQIIVAFSHGKNVSSRRVPSGADVKPGCFWGFQKEFLMFIHGLAGISVVEGA